MKNFTRSFSLFLMMMWTTVWSQAVDAPANWPNSEWEVSIPDNPPGEVLANPAEDDKFGYNGKMTTTSIDLILTVTSPVIDLTPTVDAGENKLILEGLYTYLHLYGNSIIKIQYWNAQDSVWVDWYTFPAESTPRAKLDNLCSVDPIPFLVTLDITSFNDHQLSNFRYRFFAQCNYWYYLFDGFCIYSPYLHSTAAELPEFDLTVRPDCENERYFVDVNIIDLRGAPAVEIRDNKGSPTQTTNDTGPITMGPYADKDLVLFQVSRTDEPSVKASDYTIYGCPPPYDECSGAYSADLLEFGSECNEPIVLNNEFASSSVENNGTIECEDDYYLKYEKDIWFSFTAPETEGVIFKTLRTDWLWYKVYVYESCTERDPIVCGEDAWNGREITISHLIPGHTYYVRLIPNFFLVPGDVEFCLWEFPPPPENDTCANAEEMDVTPLYEPCPSWLTVNNLGAGGSELTNGIPACGMYEDRDVWYTFTAPDTGNVLISGRSTDWIGGMAAALYTNCTDTVEVACADTPLSDINGGALVFEGLTPGTQYYMRLWEPADSVGGEIYLCAKSFDPVQNDDCTTAITLEDTEALDFDSAPKTWGHFAGATHSSDPPPNAYFFVSEAYHDIWYKFTAATDTVHIGLSTATNLAVEWYEGECDSLTSLGYARASFLRPQIDTLLLTIPVTAGEDYYLRLYTPNDWLEADPTFQLAVWHSSDLNTDSYLISQGLFYPNPVYDKLYWRSGEDPIRIQIMDLNGRVIYVSENYPQPPLHLETLPRGIYLIQTETKNKVYLQKFIKQ